ncbi:MAG: 3-isopropylmalate dehydratase [Candidatus Aminicenantes bacterium]|nr:3-isopropylmalate dehydratase [Candidatus Aminicenantes bacterium]
MEDTVLRGRIWVLLDRDGKLIEDIDTDQIYHNAFLHITDISEMGKYAFGNLEGWKDFPEKAAAGDIVIAGRNFGAGSSRQQAVDCFLALKVGAILAPSFASIYFRNAVNSGLPVLKSAEIEPLVAGRKLNTGDEVEVDFLSGQAFNLSKAVSFFLAPMSDVQREIFRAGNLFAFGRSMSRRT